MGIDETQICCYCIDKSKGMIIAENTCAGHLSFRWQNEEIKKYYEENQDKFKIKKIN